MQSGDLIHLGRHRLMCGDATNPEHVAKLFGDDRADVLFTSPPYAQQRRYAAGVGDWDELMRGAFANLPMTSTGQVLVNLGLIHRNSEWQPYWSDWIEWMRTIGWRRFGWYVWDKLHGQPCGDLCRLAPSCEFIFHFNQRARRPNKTVAKKSQNIRTISLASGGIRQPDDHSFIRPTKPELGLQTHKIPDSVFRLGREKGRIRSQHPAVFPPALAQQIITAYSDPGQIVYEPFAGSGSTIIAAEHSGRSCYAMEMEPKYCEIVMERFGLTTTPGHRLRPAP